MIEDDVITCSKRTGLFRCVRCPIKKEYKILGVCNLEQIAYHVCLDLARLSEHYPWDLSFALQKYEDAKSKSRKIRKVMKDDPA